MIIISAFYYICYMQIRYTLKAAKQIKRINSYNPKIATKILTKIDLLAINETENLDIKKLKGKSEDLYRLRVGNYRII